MASTLGKKLGTFFFAAFLLGAILLNFVGCVILEGIAKLGLLSQPTKVTCSPFELASELLLPGVPRRGRCRF